MTPTIQAVQLAAVSFPLKKPFVTAQGRKTETHNIQITVRLSDGTLGKAEASSSIAMASESQENLRHALQDMIPDLRGEPIADYKALSAHAWATAPLHPTAAAAMECALFDAAARHKKVPLARFIGAKPQSIETDITLSIAPPAELARSTREWARKGFRRFKIKLAGGRTADWERILAVHKAAPRAELVIDGNQGFHLQAALELTAQIQKAKLPVRFFEQPFPRLDLRSMRQFRKRSAFPLFADESVINTRDALRVIEAKAVDGINIKLAKCGLTGALDMIPIAQRAGVRLAIGCMEESKLGLAASVHLACGTGVFEWIDLDSFLLLDVTAPAGGFRVRGPMYSVSGVRSGIGL